MEAINIVKKRNSNSVFLLIFFYITCRKQRTGDKEKGKVY